MRAVRATILILLVLGGIVNFLDRSALSIANTTMRGDLHLSATEIGALLSAFSLAYGLAQLPAGWLLDSVGPRTVLSIGMLLWSVAQMATGMVSSFAALIATRVGLGVGEAPFLPGGFKVIHDWYEMRYRGVPTGILNGSTTVGQAFAPPLLTVLLLSYGWRSMFISIGLIGVLVGLAWYPVYRDRNSEDEVWSAPRSVRTGGWRDLFRHRTVWGMMLGFSGVNYTAWLYLAWLPGYLEAAHHLSLRKTGWLAAIPFLMGSAGMLISGFVADALVRRGFEPLRSRKVLIVSGMMCSAVCTFAVTHVSSSGTSVAIIGMALFFIHFAGTSAWGLVQVAAPARLVGSVGSLQNFCSFLFASVAPLLTGWFLDRTHSFQIALVICACVTFLGAMAYLTLVQKPIEAA
ncbi:MFS transporter [Alloacidobacterium dinghuense]|uniref:MFS transporter n=1 Tax=Alloacidobacterium dinghuense TaxID=2763107 RepID=A0A7G8BFP2_9BACT|nr:MFS transporter [Alloacidobacterium dinghuense]QNI31362.1 MFS transporter [Alloacidobacterium dinghuense]